MGDEQSAAGAVKKRFDVTPKPGGVRLALMFMFWIWGLGYGFYTLALLASANASISLGVGTSSAVSMNILFWIGGLLMFGLGAIAVRPVYEIHLADE